MNKRTRTLWIPGLTSLTASMTLRFVLQRTVEPKDKLLNHAGLPLLPQVLWLIALVLFGATSAYMSRQAGGSRASATIAAVFPAAMMFPFWTLFAINMALPSSAQWFGLFSGVLNWVVLPGVALLLGALSYFKAQSVVDWKAAMNRRTATLWLPALISLTAAMICLAVSTSVGMQSQFVARGLATSVVYFPWLVMLPFCGAAGARFSRRHGGKRWACVVSGLFPVVAMTALVALLVLFGKFVFAAPVWFHVWSAILLGAIFPGIALFVGTLPYTSASPFSGQSSPI
jgi:hypothetical protein